MSSFQSGEAADEPLDTCLVDEVMAGAIFF